MSMEMLTPTAQGFLINVKRIRVSRELSRTRRGKAMRMRSRFRSPARRPRRDLGVTLPPGDGTPG